MQSWEAGWGNCFHHVLLFSQQLSATAPPPATGPHRAPDMAGAPEVVWHVLAAMPVRPLRQGIRKNSRRGRRRGLLLASAMYV